MTSIWVSSGEGWDLLPPTGFPDERTLHALVERSPELLPLAGGPQLVVLGREVPLGGGYADLLAVEPPGRLVLIEVKLAANAEARRAVVAQILAYAAFLKGIEPEVLEGEILRSNLVRLGYESIESAVAQQDQDGSSNRMPSLRALREASKVGTFDWSSSSTRHRPRSCDWWVTSNRSHPSSSSTSSRSPPTT
jgi:hypothetical protein